VNRCAKCGVSRGVGWPFVVGGDPEDGYELVVLDLDLRDVFLDDCLALAWGAVREDSVEVEPDLFDGLRAGRLRLGLDEVGECVAADLELVELGGEVADS
jgi:hypothetical protein